MTDILAELFGIVGLDMTPPATMSELIPYFLTVLVGFAIISGMFRFFRSLSSSIIGGRLV